MKSENFYCQNKCTPEYFSIDEWNKAFDYCIKNNIPEEQMNEILDGKECEEKCFDCMAVIGSRRIKTKAIIERMNLKH